MGCHSPSQDVLYFAKKKLHQTSEIPIWDVTVLKSGILNPAINSLLSRIRHTNSLVIADRGFPYWPQIETIDISLVDDVPRVLEVFKAIQANFVIGKVAMAEEFRRVNNLDTVKSFEDCFGNIPTVF